MSNLALAKCKQHKYGAWLKPRRTFPHYSLPLRRDPEEVAEHYLIIRIKHHSLLKDVLVPLETGRQRHQISRLASMFKFRGRAVVAEFIEQTPIVIDSLFEAWQKINQYFSNQANAALEVFTDPDDSNDRRLFVLILTTLPSDEASSRLDQLDQQWWLSQPIDVKRVMNIDVEYVNASL